MALCRIAPALAAALLVAACATPSTDKPAGAAPADKPAAAVTAPGTPAVKVPAAAARKVVLTMTGPKNVVEAKDWAEFKREWRETFAEHAQGAGIAFAFHDGPGAPAGEPGTLLQVQVNDYRIVGIGSRILFGVMTGNAFIDAKIRFADLRTGATFGEQAHNTSSSAWGGIFAKVTPQQVDAIAADVFADLKAAR